MNDNMVEMRGTQRPKNKLTMGTPAPSEALESQPILKSIRKSKKKLSEDDENKPETKETIKCYFCNCKGHKVSLCRYKQRAKKITKEANKRQKEKSKDNFKKFMTENINKLMEKMNGQNDVTTLKKEILAMHEKLNQITNVIRDICERMLETSEVRNKQKDLKANALINHEKSAQSKKELDQVARQEKKIIQNNSLNDELPRIIEHPELMKKFAQTRGNEIAAIEHEDLYISNKGSFNLQLENDLDPRRCLYYLDKNKRILPYLMDFKTDLTRCKRAQEVGMRKLEEEELNWLLEFEQKMKKLKKRLKP